MLTLSLASCRVGPGTPDAARAVAGPSAHLSTIPAAPLKPAQWELLLDLLVQVIEANLAFARPALAGAGADHWRQRLMTPLPRPLLFPPSVKQRGIEIGELGGLNQRLFVAHVQLSKPSVCKDCCLELWMSRSR